MERKWPWKKKSSDKAAIERAATAAALESASASLVSVGSVTNQESYKKPNYVQISVESYTHFTGLENQVKTYEEHFQTLENQVKTYEEQFQTLENQIEELNEKLSQAWSEVETKENIVKQHAKVAEDAVVGWEKAETEVIALQSQVDSLKLSKRAAEDRATHLDNTLKEYMQQIRIMKDEHTQELRDVISSKTKQWDKIKHELETKISNLDQQLLMSDAENAALSRSVQERGNLIVQINDEKSQAEAEIEFFKGKFESCEREISSLKYELHVASKELEIRTEEKNMAVKSADGANKQHLEGVKKITKLEAECQRLRSLVRKKLPGPAALAQMRSEVDTLGRDFGNSRPRRPSNPSSPHSTLPEFDFESPQKFQKEKEFLTDRMLAMEEEMKMLKEALAKRNSELQLSRNVCAKTANKLRSLEGQLLSDNKNPLRAKTARRTLSVNSMSDDGIDDSASFADSWTTASVSGFAQSKRDNFAKPNKSDVNQLELMDDFLEMEKLAHTSIESNGFHNHPINKLKSHEKLSDPFASGNSTSYVKETSLNDETYSDQSPLWMLRTRILSVFESISAESDILETVESLKSILQNIPQIGGVTPIAKKLSSHNSSEVLDTTSEDVGFAISQIHDFVLYLGNEIRAVRGSSGEVIGLIEKFSNAVDDSLHSTRNLGDLIVELAYILSLARKYNFSIIASSSTDCETSSSDCVDKVALPENKSVHSNAKRETYSNGCLDINDSPHPELPLNISSTLYSSSDELKELLSEKERLLETLQETKSQLLEAKQLTGELKSQLTAAERSNSLAETQLKCMTESYRSLEKHANELETEVDRLKEKTKVLELEIQELKKNNQSTLETCSYLQEQLERSRNRDLSALSDHESDYKMQQEIELAAAAERLAKCQETISQLGKQFESMRPQAEIFGSPQSDRSQGNRHDQSKKGTVACLLNQTDSPNSEVSTLPETPSTTSSSKLPRHRHTMSGSSLSSTPTPEKYSGAGFRRMFTSKRHT